MKPLNSDVFYFNDDFRRQIAATAPAFLQQLEGLTVFDIKGRDSSRTRVVTTLIHGNEPSGFIACHIWLRSKAVPKTNLRIIFCNPETAQKKPIFSHRYINEDDDLNRFFLYPDDSDSTVALRARQIKQQIEAVKPEAIIDLHNTSGVSPAFGVSIHQSPEILDLVALFSARLIITGLSVGALMEAAFGVPVVTIECGGAHELASHQVASDGLLEYFTRDQLFDARERDVVLHYHPIRLALAADSSVDFANHCLLSADITLIEEIEQYNHHRLVAGEFLGWYQDSDKPLLQATDEEGEDQIVRLLRFEDGRIYTRVAMQLFMVTTNPEIATNDCICYLTL